MKNMKMISNFTLFLQISSAFLNKPSTGLGDQSSGSLIDEPSKDISSGQRRNLNIFEQFKDMLKIGNDF